MTSPRDIRRCALQALYQFDSAGDESPELIRASLDKSPGGSIARDDGFRLALAAWAQREAADAELGPFSLEWSIHRQPIVDRSILRLAYYEMKSGRTPPKVVINEAVELAKEFSTDKSPMFINGILDKLYRTMKAQTPEGPPESSPEPAPEPTPETPNPDLVPDA